MEMEKERGTRIDVLRYSDYRAYLREMFDMLKRETRYFSHRAFAKKAGFSSPNFLLLVIQGKRNLTKESVVKIARALDLNKRQEEYFENLVFMNQSKSLAEKNTYYERVAQLSKSLDVKKLENLEYIYCSTWYIPAVREMIDLKGATDEPSWFAKRLYPTVKVEEVERALRVLRDLKLIEIGNGKFRKVEKSLTTGGEARSLFIRNFHAKMIALGAESMDRFSSEVRDISSITLSITAEQLTRIKACIGEFRDAILDIATSEADAEEIYQFNVQFFPLVKPMQPKAADQEEVNNGR